jgi:hypothetical protein
MATACTWTTSSKRATRYGKRARQHGGLRPGRAWAATRPGGVGIGWQRRAAWPGRARRPGRPARRPAGGYANTARPVLEVARKGLTRSGNGSGLQVLRWGRRRDTRAAYYLMACPHLLLRLRFFPHGLHRTRGLTH